jgi:outer membrane protein assembly factor BamB
MALGAGGAGEPKRSWTQWGGPDQDFTAPCAGLAESWPATGPPKLWSRDLGEGYSAILVEDGRLYTMYRAGGQEVVVSLDAASGKPVWEMRYDSSPTENHVSQFGDGPRATPLIAGDRLFTVGVSGRLHALDKRSGKVLWSHDLWGEPYKGSVLEHGYSSSPIAHGDKVFLLVGGEAGSIVALNQKDGTVAWKKHAFKNSYSTPRMLRIAGKDELVTFMANEMVGLDPATGELLWRYAHENQWGQNINMPVMADENHLFLSSPQAGARGLKLTRGADGAIQVEELWSTRKIQFYHVSSARRGEWVYGSTGTMGPSFLAAVNIRTGEIAWRERGFAKANVLLADGRLIILDEDGALAIASPGSTGLEVHSRVQLLEKVAWTVPTVVGHTLFVRDQKTVAAYDLG